VNDDVIRALRVKGRATTEAIAASLGCDVTATVASLTAAGLIDSTRLGHRLTEAGEERAGELFGADRASLGDTGPLYDAFTEVNDAVKQIITDWQLRTVGREQMINDHTDPSYDTAVIARLGDAHQSVHPTLSTLAERISRYALYQERLDAALAAAESGDTTFVASPAKESYHTVWFELHEDLILSTGRTRAGEALAGRG
jgi:pyruvate,orthophosphate dikinase